MWKFDLHKEVAWCSFSYNNAVIVRKMILIVKQLEIFLAMFLVYDLVVSDAFW